MTCNNAILFRNKLFTILVLIALLILLPAAVYAESDPEPSGDVAADDSSATSDAPDDPAATEPSESSSSSSPETTPDSSTTETTSPDSETPSTESADSQTPPEQPSEDLSADGEGDDLTSDLSNDPPSENETLSGTTDIGDESGETLGSAIEATTDSAGSTVDQQGASPTPAAGSDEGCEVTTEAGVSTQTQYFQVAEESMNPLLPPGSIIEIVSENYTDGDLVLAQKEDGTYIVKMLAGDQLVSLADGTNYVANDLTILGAVVLSAVTQAELESSGIAWNIARATTSTPPVAGTGSTDTPYQISTWQNLYWLSQTSSDWDKHFIQTANITFPGDHNTKTGGIYDWDCGAGWTPIGNVTTKFTGSYNGQDYTISNLFINRPGTNYQGLFGFTSGTLTNIALVNVDVTGDGDVGGLVGRNDGTITSSSANGAVTGNYDVGGLVGVNNGTINNSSASGTVTGAGDYVGGLIGRSDDSTISDSHYNGNVVGENYVGGLVGRNSGGTISNSSATGAVTGTNSVGGLVGYNEGTISNSYATGAVIGTVYVGGLVGYNEGTISNSYATGAVTGTIRVGGLVGGNLVGSGLISYSFYDKDTTGKTDTGKGTPLTTAEMKTLSTFKNAGWTIVAYDPNTAPTSGWFIKAGSYPQLYWEWTPQVSEPGSGFDFSGFSFTLPPAPVTGSVLTAISGKGANPIITSAFVTGGSTADLGKAIAAYNQAKQSFEANKGRLNPAEKAVAETELAIANAAIKALELSLAAQGGQAFNMAALISAYNNALAVLNANRALLTVEQIAEAEALLQAIATVISRYST